MRLDKKSKRRVEKRKRKEKSENYCVTLKTKNYLKIFLSAHAQTSKAILFRIWVRRPLLFIYLFIYWHFIFVSLVRIRIPMQVKQKASNRYVSEITQTIIICETFDYVIWWSTLIIKKLLSFLFSLDSVCFCLFLWLSSKALNFLSNAPDQKLTFFLSFPVVFPKF